jgi:hypothetical protein
MSDRLSNVGSGGAASIENNRKGQPGGGCLDLLRLHRFFRVEREGELVPFWFATLAVAAIRLERM